jgi:hypothetical protein
MTTELIWQHLDAAGWEHVRIQDDHPLWDAYDSILVRYHQGQVLRGGYTLVTDKQWRTLELRLMLETQPGAMEALHLLTEGDGRWTDADENHLPELDGCLDVDIQWSPLTNTLPINRIPLATGEEHEIRVAYIALPELLVRPVTQRYTRIDQRTVRYKSETRDFERDLTVDADGFVTEYPSLFSRSWPK